VPELPSADRKKSPEAAARILAGSQYGRLSVQQLKDLGFSGPGITRRLQSGLWQREHRGVILVGHATADYRGRCWSAQLAYGPEAVISHESAATLWDIAKYNGPVHITLPQSRSSRRGTITHESRTLTPDNVRIHYGLRVTNPVRTLVDLADLLDDNDLERVLSEAHVLGYLQRHGLRSPETPGRRGLKRVLSRGARMTRSNLERLLLGDIRAAPDIPQPLTNTIVEGFEADMYWPQYRLVVEIDTYRTHGDSLAFQRDRDKRTAYALVGITILPVTEETLPTAIATIRRWISDHGGRLYPQ
jgi:hypothetical protein